MKFLGLKLAFMNIWDTFCIGKTMDQVHGPGPEKGFMNPWSMFCPYHFRVIWKPLIK